MMSKKSIIFLLILTSLLCSCARHRQIATFQSPFQEEVETWGVPLPNSSYKIISHFGESRRRGNHHYSHEGIDIKIEKGTDVIVVQRGTVIFADKSGNYGKLVCIKHQNQWETRYAHLSSITVKKNQEVRKGQVIGKVGQTGNATTPHLHFEIRKNGMPLNPLTLIPIK